MNPVVNLCKYSTYVLYVCGVPHFLQLIYGGHKFHVAASTFTVVLTNACIQVLTLLCDSSGGGCIQWSVVVYTW